MGRFLGGMYIYDPDEPGAPTGSRRYHPLSPEPQRPAAAPTVMDNVKLAQIRVDAATRDLRQFRHAYGDLPELADVLAAINRYLRV